MKINAYVVSRITELLPSKRVWKSECQYLKELELVNPRYDELMPVDILLGTDVVPYVTRSGRREGKVTESVELETGFVVFGRILMGSTGTTTMESTDTLITSLETIDLTLHRFWDLDELPQIQYQTPVTIKCEELYTVTTTRRPNGRYVGHLPFIQNPPQLGQSQEPCNDYTNSKYDQRSRRAPPTLNSTMQLCDETMSMLVILNALTQPKL